RLGHAGPAAIVVAYGTSLRAYTGAGAIVFTKPGAQPSDDPLAADLDGDGADEIVVPVTLPDAIAAFDSTGTPLAGWAVTLPNQLAGPPLVRVTSPFEAASVTALVSDGSHLLAFAPDGSTRGEFPKPGHAGYAPSLFDLGGDTHEKV